MKYQHLSIEEREKIQEGLWQKRSIRAISQDIGRPPSTVSREIKKNLPPQLNRYSPRVANVRALDKRRSRGRLTKLKNNDIRAYVVTHLKMRWSPEQYG